MAILLNLVKRLIIVFMTARLTFLVHHRCHRDWAGSRGNDLDNSMASTHRQGRHFSGKQTVSV